MGKAWLVNVPVQESVIGLLKVIWHCVCGDLFPISTTHVHCAGLYWGGALGSRYKVITQQSLQGR